MIYSNVASFLYWQWYKKFFGLFPSVLTTFLPGIFLWNRNWNQWPLKICNWFRNIWMARRHLFDWNTFKMAAYLQDSRCGDSMWCAGSGYQKILSFVIENSIIVFLEERLQLDLDIFSVPFTILLKNIKNCYAEFFHRDFWGPTKKCENKNLTYFFLFVRDWDVKD